MLRRVKELVSDSLIYGMSTMLSQFLSLILVPFYTKELRPEDYGVLAMSALLLGFFAPVAGLGMDGALFRFYSMTDDSLKKTAYFSLATQLKAVAMCVACGLLLPFYSHLNGSFFNGLLTPVQFALLLGTFVADNVSALTVVTLRSERRVKKIAFVNIVTLVVSLVLSIWLVLIEKMHVTGALVAGVLASSCRALLYWSDSWRYFRWAGLDRALIKDLLGYGLPTIPHKVQAQIIQIFTAFMINQELGIAATGLYAVASKVAKPLAFVVNVVQQSWVPFKFQVHKSDVDPARTFRQLTSLYWVGLIMLWGILSLLTPWLYEWLIDRKYWDGIPYVPFIMAISVAQAIYFTVTTGFELSPRQRLVVSASFVGMITLVGISLLTVDVFAPYSFIVTQALAYLIMGAVLFPEARRVIRIDYPFAVTGGFAAAVGLVVVSLFGSGNLLVLFLGVGLIVVAGLAVVKVLFPDVVARRLAFLGGYVPWI